MSKSPGRPKLADDQRRTLIARSRVTRREYEILEAKAERAGVTVSEYIRLALVYDAAVPDFIQRGRELFKDRA